MSPKSRNNRNGEARPRQHLPHVEDAVGGWTQQHSPYTIEGELEGFARLATGTRHARGPKRVVALGLVGLMLLPFGLALVNGLRWLLNLIL